MRLPWIGPLSLLAVTFATIGTGLLGPAPTTPMTSTSLFDPTVALSEPTDRLILLGWFGITALLVVWGLFGRTGMPAPTRLRGIASVALAIGALTLAVLSITWSWDSTTIWPGISTQELAIGTLLFIAIITIWRAPRVIAIGASLGTSALVLAYILPLWVQLPGSLRDSIHFAYVADEYAAVAAARIPLADYFPTYVNLLGYPIAPLLKAAPEQATLTISLWMMTLQAAALIVLVVLPTWLAGWRMIAPAIIVGVTPLFATSELWQSHPGAYSPISPSRQIFPVLVILVTFAIFRQASRRSIPVFIFISLGVLNGLTLLNNADFGSAAAVISLTGMFLLPSGQRIRGFLGQFVGITVVLIAYTVFGALASQPVSLPSWSLFARVVGLSGFNAVAMRPFGLHIAVVSLFMALFVVGLILTLRSRAKPQSFASQQGFLLFLTAGWGLLTLPYFAGRSLTPTLTGGFAFTIGMVTASALPLFRAQFAHLMHRRPEVTVSAGTSVALAAVTMIATAATFALVPNPSRTLAALASPSEELSELMELKELVNGLPANHAHILPMSSILQIQTGKPALNVTNHPFHLALSPAYTELRCQLSLHTQAERLLTTPEVVAALQMTPRCADIFRFDDVKSVDYRGQTYVTVGLR
jgi:hypothetical protein